MKAILAAAGAGLLLLACGSQPKSAPEAGKQVMPKMESQVQPAYPESARKAGATGVPIVEVTIGADGAVLGCSLTTSSGNSYIDSAAMNAARTTKWKAGMREGKPIEMKVKVPYKFKLSDSRPEKRGAAQGVSGWAGRFEPVRPAMEV